MKRLVTAVVYRYFNEPDSVFELPFIPGTCSAEVQTADDGDGRLRTLTLKGQLSCIPKCSSGPVRLHVYYDDGTMDWFGTEYLPLFIDLKSGTDGRSFSVKYSF